MVISSASVLDIGCGTGELLHRAREAGHTGRLCGLDPAQGMIEQEQFGDWDRQPLTGSSAEIITVARRR